MAKKQENQENKNKKGIHVYARYSTMSVQIIIIVLLGVLAGRKLDTWLNFSFPVFTVVCSLLSIGFALYFALRDFMK